MEMMDTEIITVVASGRKVGKWNQRGGPQIASIVSIIFIWGEGKSEENEAI